MRPVVLTIAGLDPGGGAGIVADVKTLASHGCWAAAIAATLTAQSRDGLTRNRPVEPDLLREQLDAVFRQHAPGAVKIGVLGAVATVDTVAGFLAARTASVPLVVDPVLTASAGGTLQAPRVAERIRERLLPLATVVTPNGEEAAALSGLSPDAGVEPLARALLDTGAGAVVVTGGRDDGGAAEDVLVDRHGVLRFPRLSRVSDRTHGTGCLFSSSLAARLARGDDLREAVRAAGDWVADAVRAGVAFAAGGGAPDAALPGERGRALR